MYPIYGKPNDLVEINLRDFDSSLPNQRLVGRVENGKLVKYYTRKEIDEGFIDAPVILWGDNQVDIYLMQIQGAAVATLDDGSKIRVGYADNNGHKFRGIGSILLERGLIEPKDASMVKIRE
jgi:membrane-bound lytic murein transglycosylase A